MSAIINEITASSSATRTRQRCAFARIVQPSGFSPSAKETRLLWETLFGFEHVESVAVHGVGAGRRHGGVTAAGARHLRMRLAANSHHRSA
jgi:hypothetical protein